MTETTGKIVYLVEPDKAVRDSIKTLLESFAVKVQTFSNARSFLTNVRLNGNDYLLVENALPDMTGMDLCAMVKLKDPDVSLIILTSANDPAFQEINESMVNAIMQKPLSSDKLVEVLGLEEYT